MSQQAMTGGLCRTKQCLIGFWSTATQLQGSLPFFPFCFFPKHLEHNGGDYFHPPVAWWLGIVSPWKGAVYSHTSHCPDALEKSLAAALMLLMLSAAALALRSPIGVMLGLTLNWLPPQRSSAGWLTCLGHSSFHNPWMKSFIKNQGKVSTFKRLSSCKH